MFFLCGQSSVCSKIMEMLGQNEIDHHKRQVAILSQDCFYRVLTPEQKAKALKGQFNFDHPGTRLLFNQRCFLHQVCPWLRISMMSAREMMWTAFCSFVLYRCIWQWPHSHNSVGHQRGKNSSNSCLWLCFPLQVSLSKSSGLHSTSFFSFTGLCVFVFNVLLLQLCSVTGVMLSFIQI